MTSSLASDFASSSQSLDILSIGSAIQDVFVNIPADQDAAAFVRSSHLVMSLGAKINIDYPLTEIGGGGTNTAVNFSIQGLNTGILSRIANDQGGNAVLARLKHHGVSTDFLQIDDEPDSRTGMSVILNVPGKDRTVLVNRGVTHRLDFDEIDWPRLSQIPWLYLGAFGTRSPDHFDRLVDLVKTHGTKIAFNPSMAQIQKGLDYIGGIIANTTVLVMNKSEAAILTHSPRTERITVILEKLKEMGPKLVLITDGSNGAFAADDSGNRYYVSPYPVEAVCTLGAGDAFTSTFAASLAIDDKNNQPWDIPKALKRATLNAAYVVQNPGAQLGLEPLTVLDERLKTISLAVEALTSGTRIS